MFTKSIASNHRHCPWHPFFLHANITLHCLVIFIKCIIVFQLFLNLNRILPQQNEIEKQKSNKKSAIFFGNSICMQHFFWERYVSEIYFNKIKIMHLPNILQTVQNANIWRVTFCSAHIPRGICKFKWKNMINNVKQTRQYEKVWKMRRSIWSGEQF